MVQYLPPSTPAKNQERPDTSFELIYLVILELQQIFELVFTRQLLCCDENVSVMAFYLNPQYGCFLTIYVKTCILEKFELLMENMLLGTFLCYCKSEYMSVLL